VAAEGKCPGLPRRAAFGLPLAYPVLPRPTPGLRPLCSQPDFCSSCNAVVPVVPVAVPVLPVSVPLALVLLPVLVPVLAPVVALFMLLRTLPVNCAGCVTLAQDPQGWDHKAETLEMLRRDPATQGGIQHRWRRGTVGAAVWAHQGSGRERVLADRLVSRHWLPEIETFRLRPLGTRGGARRWGARRWVARGGAGGEEQQQQQSEEEEQQQSEEEEQQQQSGGRGAAAAAAAAV